MQAITLAILGLGSARTPHVLRVRSGFSALAVPKLPALITPEPVLNNEALQPLQRFFYAC
ncbi:MAG TPA: hypothetical protein DIW66_09950 [Serratia liquefaciens]|nr:hypothetical protein [Serratia liquefaciens]